VRANAVACLCWLCDSDSREALREVAGLLRSDAIHCRWAAAQALAALARRGDRALLAEVLPVLQSEDRFVRQDAAGAMFGILHEPDFPAIVEALGSPPDKASPRAREPQWTDTHVRRARPRGPRRGWWMGSTRGAGRDSRA
jgi:HEAT repeat protein